MQQLDFKKDIKNANTNAKANTNTNADANTGKNTHAKVPLSIKQQCSICPDVTEKFQLQRITNSKANTYKCKSV